MMMMMMTMMMQPPPSSSHHRHHHQHQHYHQVCFPRWGSSRSSSAHRSQEIKTPTELFGSGPELSTSPGEMEHQAASQHPPMLV